MILSLVSITSCSADSDATDAGSFLITVGMSASEPAPEPAAASSQQQQQLTDDSVCIVSYNRSFPS